MIYLCKGWQRGNVARRAIRLDATGGPDQEWQPLTTLAEAEKTLRDYHVGF